MLSRDKQLENQGEPFEKLVHHYLSPSLLLQKDQEILEKQEIKNKELAYLILMKY